MRAHSCSVAHANNFKLLFMYRTEQAIVLAALTLFGISVLLFIPGKSESLFLDLFVQNDIFGEILEIVVVKDFFLAAEKTGQFRKLVIDVLFEAGSTGGVVAVRNHSRLAVLVEGSSAEAAKILLC